MRFFFPTLIVLINYSVKGNGEIFFTNRQVELRAINEATGIPVPSIAQVIGSLQHPFTIFEHYSICTYTGCQWDLSTSPASVFSPPDSGPYTNQWMQVYKDLGATQVCLTVRHVDGFSLWRTKSTNYSVEASLWRNGTGDVVRDFVASAREAGLSPCLYIIIGFNVEANHSNVPGPQYLDNQVLALTELLTSYGQIDRLWWDNYAIGCCQPVTHEYLYCPGGGTTSTPSPACPGWQVVIDTVRALSPSTSIVPGPDGCLINGETAGGTYPLYHATSVAQNSYSCTDANSPNGGSYFAVTESDYTILNPGDNWFQWPTDAFLSAADIYDQLNLKLEQGANLIFNIPPNSTGYIPDEYIQQLKLVSAARSSTFSNPLASLSSPVSESCSDLSIVLNVSGDFDMVFYQEDLTAGQVIATYTLETQSVTTGLWTQLSNRVHGKTVGLRLIDFVGLQTGVNALRFNCSSDLSTSPSSSGVAIASISTMAAYKQVKPL
jgi:alpha-L-fucosidase